jgi:tetratricopeptide (TPR) repeat protein
MTSRTRLLAIVLGVLALVAAAEYGIRLSRPDRTGTNWQREMSPEFERQWAAIIAADKIVDVVVRCKQYPDAPWLHWKSEMVNAFCEALAKKSPSFAEITKALQDGGAERLEQQFQGYRDEGLSDPKQRGLLGRALGRFYNDRPETGEFVDKWISLAPRSPFALTARGMRYMALAFEARGTGSTGATPSDNFRRMHKLMAKARTDLDAAVSIDAKIMPAYVELIELGKATSDRELIEYAARTALAIDPTDEDVYQYWMRASQPRWGGSMRQMEEVASKAAKYVDRNPRLALLMEKPLAYPANMVVDSRNADFIVKTLDQALQSAPSTNDLELAGDAALVARQPERALWYYSQAWRFSADPLRMAPRARALMKLGKPELAKQALPDSIDPAQLDATSLSDIADIYWELEIFDKAELLFEEVLKRNPHDQYAMSSLSNLYQHPPKREDKARAMVTRLLGEYPNNADGWYYDFMLKFSDKEERSKSLRKFLALVNRNDPYEQQRITEAKMWLGEKEE